MPALRSRFIAADDVFTLVASNGLLAGAIDAAGFVLHALHTPNVHEFVTFGGRFNPLAAALPEPTTIALLAIALLAIVAILRVTRGRHRRQGRRHQRTLPPA